MSRTILRPALLSAISMILSSCSPNEPATTSAPAEKAAVTVSWEKVVRVSKTTPTLQVVVNPPLRRGAQIHDRVFQALRELGGDYVRYVPWLPYPKLGVAELEPPKDGRTSWDFSLIDPMTIDFLEATAGHSTILNFSTIPQWMFKTPQPVTYPQDPDQVTWNYTQGTELRDPSMKELGDYYMRLMSWYTKGGFTDELGKEHHSGHHYPIPYWEVLNEVDFEHNMTPQQYTARYDAIVAAIHHVSPQTKFVGMALAIPGKNPGFFEYFLNHRNHKPRTPLDMISYHFYASPSADQSPEVQQHTFFLQADGFLDLVRYIEAIRQRLSPETKTTIDEIGAISADDGEQAKPGHATKAIPNSYWNLAGAMYAYIYAELARLGVDVAGESQLVGYPTQFPSVSMVDWNTGQPNARFWVLKLLRDNLGPGDKLVETHSDNPYIYTLGFVSQDGRHKLLLINKRDRPTEVSVRGAGGGEERYVDQGTALKPPASLKLNSETVSLGGLAVAIVIMP
jgi:hypothetical protein